MKRLLLFVACAVAICAALTAHAATLLPGSQINRVWPQTNNGGQSGLQVLGTVSGTNLYAVKSITGTDVYAVRIAGGGLTSCSNAANSKLLYNSSTKTFSCGTDQNAGAWSNTGSLQAAFDARYVRTAGGTMTGNLLVRATISGSALRIDGLTSCPNTKTNASGVFSCNALVYLTSEMPSVNTGGVLALGDARYVRKAGSTMTGALTVNLTSGYLGLKVLQTASGDSIHAEKGLSSSGTIVAAGLVQTKGTLSGENLTVSGVSSMSGVVVLKGNLLSKGTLSGQNLIVSGVSSFSGAVSLKKSLTAKGTISGANLIVSGVSSMSGVVVLKGSLLSKGTLSGQNLVISGVSSFSGASVFKSNLTSRGTISGATINANGLLTGATLQGFGLYDCSNASTSKVLWNVSTKKFSCGTDQTAASGLTYGTANAIFVNKAGATMTGQLVINLSSGFYGLKLLNTMSGNILHAEKDLTSSGTLTVKGNAAFKATLSGSFVSPRYMMFELTASGTALTTGSGKLTIGPIPPTMSGYNLTGVWAQVDTAGTTGLTRICLRDVNKGKRAMFSTCPSIDSAETSTTTAATNYVIDSTKRDVGAYDELSLDILQIQTTAPKGLDVTLEFTKP